MQAADVAIASIRARERLLYRIAAPSQLLYWGCLLALAVWLAPFSGVGVSWDDYLRAPNHHEVTVAVLLGVATIITGVPTRLLLIARVRAERDAMAWLAIHDDLTGLYNRRHFYSTLTAEVTHGRPVAVVLLDVDGLKQTNDCYGHVAGDVLIREVADRLVVASNGRLVARTGGDEFAVVLTASDERMAVEAAASLCRAVGEQPLRVSEDCQFHPSISAGVAASDGASRSTVDGLLRAADQRLYDDKRRHLAARAA